MKQFTINDLERFSGIKAHTLRVWESRYAVVQPARSGRNNRLYSVEELKKILNISLLQKHGYRISTLSKTSSGNIDEKINKLPSDFLKWQKAIHDLTINMYALDPGSFEAVLDELLLKWPTDILVDKVIYPFLNITGLLWKGNKLPEEHLVVTALRKKLILSIESSRVHVPQDRSVLLFLPDNSQLDLGLLYSYYYFNQRGKKVLYLGNDVTNQNLKTIFQATSLSYVFTYLPANTSFDIQLLQENIKVYAPGCKLIIGTYPDGLHCDNDLYMQFHHALDFINNSPA